MPTYEYECKSCRNRFEERQSFSSEPVATCPVCMNGARRIFHAVPIMFKGAGFYVNDYGKGSRTGTETEADSSKKKDNSDSGSGNDSRAETASASKTEAKSESSSESKSDAGSKTATATSKGN